MAFRRRWLLILFALVLGGGQLFAASAKEQRAYAAAVAAFQDEMWSRAETEFAQFIQKYPKSTNAPEAVLLQAQAEFKQGKFTNAIALLNPRKAGGRRIWPTNTFIGSARRNFRTGILPARRKPSSHWRKIFPNRRCGCGPWWRRRRRCAQLGRLAAGGRAAGGNRTASFSARRRLDPGNELVSRGRLLLAQAKFAQKDFAGASAILASLNPQTLKPELDWQRAYLLYQAKLAAGDTNAALAAATNLLQIARLGNDDDLARRERGVARGRRWNKLGRTAEADGRLSGKSAPTRRRNSSGRRS